MPVHDELGKRMKEFYETVSKTKLVRRTPVAIRIDGKAFHTFTEGMQKPFDEVLVKSMQDTMMYLCKNIQGCVLGYTQSDEITLILQDYAKLDTCAWFDYEVQKMCSVSASMATMAFNKAFKEAVHEWFVNKSVPVSQEDKLLYCLYKDKSYSGALFDARCFNIPKEEVTNLIYWRQNDASRNSIQMLGQAYFSHSELDHKTTSNIQDMLMTKYGVNWNDLPTHLKRGSCCVRGTDSHNVRPQWKVDLDIPIFKGDGRQYVERLINFED